MYSCTFKQMPPPSFEKHTRQTPLGKSACHRMLRCATALSRFLLLLHCCPIPAFPHLHPCICRHRRGQHVNILLQGELIVYCCRANSTWFAPALCPIQARALSDVYFFLSPRQDNVTHEPLVRSSKFRLTMIPAGTAGLVAASTAALATDCTLQANCMSASVSKLTNCSTRCFPRVGLFGNAAQNGR